MNNFDLKILYNNKTRYLAFSVLKDYENDTIKSFLKNKLLFSEKMLNRIKHRKDGILINDKYCFINAIIHENDVVKIRLCDIGEIDTTSQSIWATPPSNMPPLSILYEDDDLLFLNKKSGIVCHPSPGHYADTLSNQVAFHLGIKKGAIYPIGRLDKDTSGIVLFAKNSDSATIFTKEQMNNLYKKTYYAWVEGEIKEDNLIIDKPIREKPNCLMLREVHKDGKPAKTFVKKIRFSKEENRTLIEVKISNGRTHQIRVHLASIGHPICEDPLYNKKSDFKDIRESNTINKMNRKVNDTLKLQAYKVSFLTPYFYERKEIILSDNLSNCTLK